MDILEEFPIEFGNKIKRVHTEEYKENAPLYAIERDYISPFIKSRMMFFHTTARKYRKGINTAGSFCSNSNITVLFLYGDEVKESSLIKAVEGQKGKVLVLQFPFPKEWLSVINESDKVLKHLADMGHYSKEKRNDPRDYYRPERDKTVKALALTDLSEIARADIEKYKAECEEYISILDKREQTLLSIADAQRGVAKAYATFSLKENEVSLSDEDFNETLLSIIRDVFPYGVESDTTDPFAIKVLAVPKLIEDAMSDNPFNEPTARKLGIIPDSGETQMSFFYTPTVGAMAIVAYVKQAIAKAIEKDGVAHISDIMGEVAESPYGFYASNWYSFLFAVAVKEFWNEKHLYYDGLLVYEQADKVQLQHALRGGYIVENSDKRQEIVRALDEIFNTNCGGLFTGICHIAIGIISETRSVPLDFYNHKWLELFSLSAYAWCYRKAIDYFYDFLVLEKEKRKSEVLDNGKKVFKELTAQYGTRQVRLCHKWCRVKGGASGWLHTKEWYLKGVENFMQRKVCRECGKPLAITFEPMRDLYLARYSEGDTEFEFTEKDIVGLNQKLLGRYQTESFCIDCLAEYVECTPYELYDKMQGFKEQGCTLF